MCVNEAYAGVENEYFCGVSKALTINFQVNVTYFPYIYCHNIRRRVA